MDKYFSSLGFSYLIYVEKEFINNPDFLLTLGNLVTSIDYFFFDKQIKFYLFSTRLEIIQIFTESNINCMNQDEKHFTI